MPASATERTMAASTNAVASLQRRVHHLEMKNRLLRLQLSQMRITNVKNYNLVESYRSEAGRREQRIGELLIQRLSGEYDVRKMC